MTKEVVLSHHPMIDRMAEVFSTHSGKFLLGVSGGIDSMCLLDASVRALRDIQCQPDISNRIGIAHVNHSLRETAYRDAKFVAHYAEGLHLPFFSTCLTPPDSGENVEAWARRERYSFFTHLMNTEGYDQVFIAHHGGDLLETFLMRILSNKEPRAIRAENLQLKALRPFLHFNREDILQYANTFDVPHVEDESNQDTARLRNLVRSTLIPFLEEKFGKGVSHSLKKQALSIEKELDALDEVAKTVAEGLLKELDFGNRIWLVRVKEILRDSPPAIGERVLRSLFLPYSRTPLGREASARLRNFLLSGEVAIQLPGGLEIRRRKGGLAIASTYGGE